MRFDIENSPSLGPRQRARLLERLGPIVRVVASERRSQHQNRELALERLRSRLAERCTSNPTRVADASRRARRRSAASTQKRQHGEIKRARRRPDRRRGLTWTRVGDVLLIVVGVVAVVIVLDAAIRTFVVPRGTRRALHGRSCSASLRRVFTLFASPQPRLRGARPRDGAVRAVRAARAAGRVAARRLRRRSRASSSASSTTAGASAFDHERVVAAHARLRTAARPAVGVRRVHARRAIGLGAARARHRVPPDDLQLVLAPRDRGHRPVDPRRHAADAARDGSTRAHLTGFLNDMDTFWDAWMTWFTEVQETHTSYGVARVLPFAEPASQLGHRGGRGARHRGDPARGARHAVDAERAAVHPLRLPRAARDRGLLRLRLRRRSRRPTTRSASPATSSTRSATRSPRAGVPLQGRPRPGVARLRGLARELRRACCSRWPRW